VPRIHLVSNLPGAGALGDHLRSAGLGPTSARAADALVVLVDRPLDPDEQEVLDRARQSVPVLLAGPTLGSLSPDSPLVEATGLAPARVMPVHALRIGAGPRGHDVAARLPAGAVFVDSWTLLDKVADDVQQLLTVRYEMTEQAVCTWRPSTGLGTFTLGAAAATLADPAFHRLVGRWLRHALGQHDAPAVGVGILGTTSAAARHANAVAVTPGLELAAVTDGPAGRPAIELGDARGVRRATNPAELVADSDLGLLVVATRTNTRADWAMRAIETGKHVLIEAPACLSTHDADELAALASAADLTITAHGRGRAYAVHRAALDAVRRGDVGTVFSVEVFAGAHRHPRGTWHDDARLSGGQLFDRGAGLVEWIIELVGEPVEWVSSTARTLVWHDVTNADHTAVLLHFAGGTEARIVVSDLAAAGRPAFTVLGTAGALVGPVAGADGATDRMALHAADGSVTHLAPPPPDEGFHAALADHLVSGWPVPVPWAVSRRTVAVLEAAARSAATGGAPTTPA
jgi:scyllo-inositol 2-dehydrogenase (NADP+)